MDCAYIVNFHLTCDCSDERELYTVLDDLIQFGKKNAKFKIILNYSNRAAILTPLPGCPSVDDEDEEDD